jgi:hypothetical protein
MNIFKAFKGLKLIANIESYVDTHKSFIDKAKELIAEGEKIVAYYKDNKDKIEGYIKQAETVINTLKSVVGSIKQ